jgi:hypothetical protein
MTEQQRELSNEELEEERAEDLPDREEMSLLTTIPLGAPVATSPILPPVPDGNPPSVT